MLVSGDQFLAGRLIKEMARDVQTAICLKRLKAVEAEVPSRDSIRDLVRPRLNRAAMRRYDHDSRSNLSTRLEIVVLSPLFSGGQGSKAGVLIVCHHLPPVSPMIGQ